ncbi:MAG: hypothetical protein COY63_00205 [Candidatus Huberarchaeum crystalense]|uniref:Uncharacterized protein n=1 Tax=Huberarchaeum crystalense TaxID=2014257 RepID=A0A2H9PAI5_HUBC1|nr:MAG: hypothetical protein COY63_00205 [Candidatus Huberarchaeum crystalense]
MINKSRKTPIAFASIQTAGLGAISFGIFQIYQSNLLGGIIMVAVVAVGWFLLYVKYDGILSNIFNIHPSN